MMKNMGMEPTKAEFNKLFDQLDTNGDGELTFDEFLNGMRWLKKGLSLVESEEEEEESNNLNSKREDLEKKITVLSKVFFFFKSPKKNIYNSFFFSH